MDCLADLLNERIQRRPNNSPNVEIAQCSEPNLRQDRPGMVASRGWVLLDETAQLQHRKQPMRR